MSIKEYLTQKISLAQILKTEGAANNPHHLEKLTSLSGSVLEITSPYTILVDDITQQLDTILDKKHSEFTTITFTSNNISTSIYYPSANIPTVSNELESIKPTLPLLSKKLSLGIETHLESIETEFHFKIKDIAIIDLDNKIASENKNPNFVIYSHQEKKPRVIKMGKPTSISEVEKTLAEIIYHNLHLKSQPDTDQDERGWHLGM